ncbi:MAG: hypothetical protein WD770_09330 [Actinomycetota bacterium]
MADGRRKRVADEAVEERPTPSAEAGAAERVARLRDRVSKLRIRGWSMDVPRMLMLVGGVLLILGLLVIGAGWYGAAHTPYLFEQVPYMISGGLLGIGLVAAGGFLYFAYWMTRQVDETKRQAARTQEALEQVQRALTEALAARPASGRAAAGRSAKSNGSFVATKGGSMFHRPECPVVAGRDDLRKVSAEGELEPCRMCDPLGAEASRI